MNVHYGPSHLECSLYTDCGLLCLRRSFLLPSTFQLSGDGLHIPQIPGLFRPFAATKKSCHSWNMCPASSIPPLTRIPSVNMGYWGDEGKTDKKCVCVCVYVCVDVSDITYCHGGTYDLTSALWLDIIVTKEKGVNCFLEIWWHKWEIGWIR